MGRLVGIDYGEKRIGLALSDATGTVATPWRVITVRSLGQAVQDIADALADQDVEEIVIGLPMRMDGGAGPASEKTKAFGALLEKSVQQPICYADERFSTRTAEQVLIEGGTRRNRRKQVVDKLAAQIILQHYLDTRAGLPEQPFHAQ